MMKNRILLLCLKKRIYTVSEYAKIMSLSEDEALAILTEKCDLNENLIKMNCDYFKVSREYLLCEI